MTAWTPHHTAGSGLYQVSVASEQKVYVVDNVNKKIEQLSGSTLAGRDDLKTPESVESFEAGTNNEHWFVSSAGRLFRYIPPN